MLWAWLLLPGSWPAGGTGSCHHGCGRADTMSPSCSLLSLWAPDADADSCLPAPAASGLTARECQRGFTLQCCGEGGGSGRVRGGGLPLRVPGLGRTTLTLTASGPPLWSMSSFRPYLLLRSARKLDRSSPASLSLPPSAS